MGAIASTPAVRYTPSASKIPTAENYLDLADMNYSTHELPDIDKTLNRSYGSQMIDGWFEKTGRKIPYASDVITWTEEDRLTQLASGVARTANVFTLAAHTFRAGEVIQAFKPDGSVSRQGRISSTTTTTFTALCGDAAGWDDLGTTGITCFADISEFLKGSAGMQESLNTKYQQYTTRGTITKEMVSENRTNMTQISWLKATDNSSGDTVGYVWYYVNKENTEKRFKNKRESANFNSKEWSGDLAAAGYGGREGLLASMAQGNIYSGFIADRASAESMIDRLEKQGQLRDNIIYGTTAFCFAQDSFLADTNTVGMSYGAFNNDKNMALDLSFKGYSLGGYEFNYSALQYLKEATAQGAMAGATKVNGFLIPSASQSVVDPMEGTTSVRPMIHVRNRSYGAMNRDYELSVFDWKAGTNNEDKIRTEFQSEQATVLIGRNNTILFRG
jgi:hypothetical protein